MIKSLWKNKLQRAKCQGDIDNVCKLAEIVQIKGKNDVFSKDYIFLLKLAGKKARELQGIISN